MPCPCILAQPGLIEHSSTFKVDLFNILPNINFTALFEMYIFGYPKLIKIVF